MKTNQSELKEKRTLEQLYALRKQAIRMLEKGIGIMQVADLTGLTWEGVNAARTLYQQGGIAMLRPPKRGVKAGTKRSLSASQEQEICQLICDKRPEQLKMDFALWSCKAVMQLIEQQYGVKLHERTIGKYLARWGFTPQKPIKKAYEQQPAAVRKWMDEDYPAIAQKAKEQGCEIHWVDETAIMNTDVRGRSYAPRGKTPTTYAVGGTRHKLSMIASVTNQGKMRWMIIDESFNSDKLIEFMASLIVDTDRKRPLQSPP